MSTFVEGNGGLATNSCITKGKFGDLYSRFRPNREFERNRPVMFTMEAREYFLQIRTKIACRNIVQENNSDWPCDIYFRRLRGLQLGRDWLARCESISNNSSICGSTNEELSRSNEKHSIRYRELERTIWTNKTRDVGFKVKVRVRRRESELAGDRQLVGNANEDHARSTHSSEDMLSGAGRYI